MYRAEGTPDITSSTVSAWFGNTSSVAQYSDSWALHVIGVIKAASQCTLEILSNVGATKPFTANRNAPRPWFGRSSAHVSALRTGAIHVH
eukprot:5463079-Amphidinium_carterae.2